MGFYTHDDIIDLEQWALDAWAARANANTRLEEPVVSPNLKTFLRYTLVTQWEVKLVRVSGEVLKEQLGVFWRATTSSQVSIVGSGSRCSPPGLPRKGRSSWRCLPMPAGSGCYRVFGHSFGASVALGRRPFCMSCTRRCGKNLRVA